MVVGQRFTGIGWLEPTRYFLDTVTCIFQNPRYGHDRQTS